MVPPRPPPKPDRPPALDQQPERGSVRHSGVDGVPMAPPVPRKLTSPGGFSIPQPDLLKTERAPRLDAPTVRATPAGGIPAQSPEDAAQEALRRHNRELEAELAEFRRRERVQAEAASPNSYPPKTVERHPSPPPATRAEVDSKPPDAELGKAGRWLARKAWPYVVAALGVGGGVTAVARPTTDPVKMDAVLARLEAIEHKQDRIEAKQTAAADREADRDDFIECLYQQQIDYFEQLLPSQERLTTAQPLRTWIDRCRNRRPKR